MLYIVLAESDEYSDRWVWVAAVYLTEAEARDAMQAAIERRGVWESWDHNRQQTRFALARQMGIDLLNWRNTEEWKRLDDATAERIPDESPKERGERFQIVEIEPGKWFGDEHDNEFEWEGK